MKTYTIKSWRGGIADYEDKGIAGAFKWGSGIDPRKRKDTLSCQQATVNDTTSDNAGVFSGLIKNYVNTADGGIYGFSDDGKIYKWNSGTVTWDKVYTDAHGAIKGAAQWWLISGKTYLFWACDTHLHCKELPGLSNWTDVDALAGYPKADLTSATSHFMTITQGHLEIANGNTLAEVNSDGSYTNESLNVLPTDIINTLIEAQTNTTLLGTFKSNGAHRGTIFKWDANFNAGVAVIDTWEDKRIVPSQGVNTIVNGEITLLQTGTDGMIYTVNPVSLSSLTPLLQLPTGGQANPGASDNLDGLALIGIYGATAVSGNVANGIYSYGRLKKNGSMILNLEYAVDCDELGALIVVEDDILFSYVKDGIHHSARVDVNNKAEGICISLDLFNPSSNDTMLDQKAVWGTVQVETEPLPAGTKIEVWVRCDKDGIFVQAQLEGGETQMTSGTLGVFQCQINGELFEYMTKLIPTGNDTPQVIRQVVGFE